MFSIKKKHEEKKEKLTEWPKRRESRRLGHYRVVGGGTGVDGGRCGGRYAVLGVLGVLGTLDVVVVVDFVIVVVVGGVVLRMSWRSLAVTYV